MPSWLRRRPSPALVVAMLALVVGLSGSALAADVVRIAKGSLSGNRLKPRTVSGDRIKRNSLTSAEVAESRLSKVPLAARADVVTLADRASIADSAMTAGSVDGSGFLGIEYDAPAGNAPRAIFDRSGLKLTANCASGQLTLVATASGSNDNSLAVTGIESATPATTGGGDDPDFDTGDSFDVAGAMGAGDGDEVLGRLMLSTSSSWTLSAELWLDESATGCRVHGFAMGGV